MTNQQHINTLYYGDCLTIMQEMASASIDLIYLDPPFNSDQSYHNIYKTETDRPLPEQVEAFNDMWYLSPEREEALKNLPEFMLQHGIDSEILDFWQGWEKALRSHDPKLLSYLSYMIERLIIMRGLLKPTGSIYLHCDPTASHYLKVMMDVIFGKNNFRREIIWDLQTASGYKSKVNGFIRGHDTLLYYIKSQSFIFNK